MNSCRIVSIFTRTALLAGFMIFSCAVRADLISQDSPYGTDTLTLDTDSSLLWLDLDLTAGRSFNDVNSQLVVGGEFEGYRYATRDEVLQLWTHASIPDITQVGPTQESDFTAANLAPAMALTDLISVTEVIPLGSVSEGLTATAPDGDDTMRIVGELSMCTEPVCKFIFPHQQNVALASLGPHLNGVDEVVSYVGSYLVMPAVPVPGSAILFLSALPMFAATRLFRRPNSRRV